MERSLTMRILLIDDEPVALTKLELMLKKNMGHCDTAVNGVSATEQFVNAINQNQPYDLVTIDIDLPDVTGLDLLNRFSALEAKNQIPVSKKIMITAHSHADYVIKARSHCDAYLVKPVRKAALLEKISSLFPTANMDA
jgi:two-component system chemotaxis response regulator CheY